MIIFKAKLTGVESERYNRLGFSEMQVIHTFSFYGEDGESVKIKTNKHQLLHSDDYEITIRPIKSTSKISRIKELLKEILRIQTNNNNKK